MDRLIVEALAFALAVVFVAIAIIAPASRDEDVAFWIALIGSLAIWEIAGFILARKVGST